MRAVGIAVEEAAQLVFQLAHALDRAGDKRPGKILIRQPGAAFDGIHEVALDGIAGAKRDVVAALDHARAAAFAEQSLDRDRDGERWIGLVRVQCGEQPRATGAEDQDIGVQLAHGHAQRQRDFTPSAASAAARRARAPALTAA